MKIKFRVAGSHRLLDMKKELEAAGNLCIFGRRWWFWIPTVKKPWNYYDKLIQFYWLCFCVEFSKPHYN